MLSNSLCFFPAPPILPFNTCHCLSVLTKLNMRRSWMMKVVFFLSITSYEAEL